MSQLTYIFLCTIVESIWSWKSEISWCH